MNCRIFRNRFWLFQSIFVSFSHFVGKSFLLSQLIQTFSKETVLRQQTINVNLWNTSSWKTFKFTVKKLSWKSWQVVKVGFKSGFYGTRVPAYARSSDIIMHAVKKWGREYLFTGDKSKGSASSGSKVEREITCQKLRVHRVITYIYRQSQVKSPDIKTLK